MSRFSLNKDIILDYNSLQIDSSFKVGSTGTDVSPITLNNNAAAVVVPGTGFTSMTYRIITNQIGKTVYLNLYGTATLAVGTNTVTFNLTSLPSNLALNNYGVGAGYGSTGSAFSFSILYTLATGTKNLTLTCTAITAITINFNVQAVLILT